MQTRKIRQVIENQRILTAPPGLSVRDAARRMAEARVGAIMITQSDRLIGIFTERDALVRVLSAGLDASSVAVGDVMTHNPMTSSPEVPLGHALHLMFEGGFRHVPIVEDGHPVGMISARDALGPELVDFEHELEQRDSITGVL